MPITGRTSKKPYETRCGSSKNMTTTITTRMKTMTQIAIRHITPAEPTPTTTANSTNNVVGIGTVLPGLADNDADIATIKMLNDVLNLRSQLRALEPQLSKAITEFGLRRGWRGYREFYLTNELNQKQYVEK